MIVKQVAAGAKTAGLLAYLYGPGVGEARGGTVHLDPRTVASWDGQPGLHQATRTTRGRLSIGTLARTLDAPVLLAERPPAKHVGHIVVANHPDDPVLSDRQWQRIAADVMKRSGLARGPGDPDAVRWVAVRHDDTSIHIAYTKVRESGRQQGYVNYTKAWEQLRHDWETRLGLTPAGRADGGSRRPYGKAEYARAKAQRFAGDSTARPDSARLRRECRLAAMTSKGLDGFMQKLAERGVTVESGERGMRVGIGSGPLRDLNRLDPSLSADTLQARWDRHLEATASPGFPSLRGAAGRTLATNAALQHDDLVDVLHACGELSGRVAFTDCAEALSVRAPSVAVTRRPSRTELGHRAAVLDSLMRVTTSSDDSGRDVERLALAVAALICEVGLGHDDVRLQLAVQTARRELGALATGSPSVSAQTAGSIASATFRDARSSPSRVR